MYQFRLELEEKNVGSERTKSNVYIFINFMLETLVLICQPSRRGSIFAPFPFWVNQYSLAAFPLVPLVMHKYTTLFALRDILYPYLSSLNEHRTTFLQSTGNYVGKNN